MPELSQYACEYLHTYAIENLSGNVELMETSDSQDDEVYILWDTVAAADAYDPAEVEPDARLDEAELDEIRKAEVVVVYTPTESCIKAALCTVNEARALLSELKAGAKEHAYLAAVEATTEGLTAISTGLSADCAECYWNFNPGGLGPKSWVAGVESGHVCADGSFSRWSCDVCGTTVAGTKEPGHAIHEFGFLTHLDAICRDCVLFLANGDLPENWRP